MTSLWLDEESAVKKINLFEMYVFGKALTPLAGVTPETKTTIVMFELWDARQKLIEMTTDGSPLLNTAKRASQRLIASIDQVIPRDVNQMIKISPDAVLGWLSGPAIKNGIAELESVLGNDMPDIASYVASQKGIYRTDDLIAHAEFQLSGSARVMLPAQACTDIREAGKCLAYEVPTACAFHLWRAVETVMGYYYQVLSGGTFSSAKVARNWAAYIAALNKAGAEARVTTFLDHIRGEYRNPQTHPDEAVTVEEAQRLFSVALSSIEQMLLEGAKPKASVASTAAAAVLSATPGVSAATVSAKP